MTDYGFYTAAYLGTVIPEKQFKRCMARAGEALAHFERIYTVTGGAEERRLALCAMAEAIYTAANRSGVVSATVGSVSVRYLENADRQLWRELYDRARIYLNIYRGVAVC